MLTILAAGLLLGLAGSAHCLGMCGPLVLFAKSRIVAPAHAGGSATGALVRHACFHHAGRLAMYVALGAMAGLTGGAIAGAGFRDVLAITAGLALVVNALGRAGLLTKIQVAGRFSRVIVHWLGASARAMSRHHVSGSLAVGALNGLLPCGLLYAALAAAVGLGDPLAAIGFMAAFGIGSLPAFAALALSAGTAASWIPKRVRQAAPVAIALIGLLLIARGTWTAARHDMTVHAHGHRIAN
jgi:hypothetical protein